VIVDRPFGDPATQLLECHSAADIDAKL